MHGGSCACAEDPTSGATSVAVARAEETAIRRANLPVILRLPVLGADDCFISILGSDGTLVQSMARRRGRHNLAVIREDDEMRSGGRGQRHPGRECERAHQAQPDLGSQRGELPRGAFLATAGERRHQHVGRDDVGGLRSTATPLAYSARWDVRKI